MFSFFIFFQVLFDSFHYVSSIVSMLADLLQFGIIYSYLNLLVVIIIYYFLFSPGLIVIPPD